MEFLENGRLEKVSVDADQSEQLIRLLDAVVIRLEGGTDFDLQVLEEQKTTNSNASNSSSQANKTNNSNAPTSDKTNEPPVETVKQEEEESKPFILGEE